LGVLPADQLNKYDLVVKQIDQPTFDMYRAESDYEGKFNEVVYKMAQTYFAVFSALFNKNNDQQRDLINKFLQSKDPLERSRKIVKLYQELQEIIDKKLFYVYKTADEMKDRSKNHLLEQAFQKLLEETKQSDKEKYQEKLDAVVNMPESVRKILQEEINGLNSKSEQDVGRKTNYLNQVFRLPWD
jgi:ABC-type taurine transport system substrate-binding protein